MGDLISRSALLRKKTRMTEYDEIGCGVHVIVVRAEDIENSPAIDAEPVRHAQWIWDNDAIDWNLGGWVCSECGARNENIHAMMPNGDKGLASNPYVWRGAKFCPNCGARMDAEVNDHGSDSTEHAY